MIEKELTTKEKEEEVVKFTKDAFCINGTVEMIHKPIKFNAYLKCDDKERGTFYISWSNEK